MRSHAFIGLLAEPERLRVVSALALGADTTSSVTERTGLAPPVVARALRRLEAGGLVSRNGATITLHQELFARAARDEAPQRVPEEHGVEDPTAAAVLRAFVRDGRLVRIPASVGKRRVVLRYLVTVFEPGVRYAEKEVDALLRAWHPDHASLRRYLVDERLMSREAGVYWRSGGPVDISPTPTPTPTRVRAPVRVQRVAAYGLAEVEGRYLLTRLGRGVHEGRWTLPGGGVEFGERPLDALHREMREETGLSVRVEELLDVDAELMRFERAGERVESHPVRILYRVTPTGGTLHVQEVDGSTAEAAWIRPGDLDENVLTPFAAAALRTGRLRDVHA